MPRVFRLGDFFGLTATQIAVFKPKAISELLRYKYTSQNSESLYSLYKEFEYLNKSLDVGSTKPDYDTLIPVFKRLGYLELTPSDKDGVAKRKIANFYKDYQEKDSTELRELYGIYTDEIIEAVTSSLTIDVVGAFPNISPEAKKIVEVLYNNKSYIKDVATSCKKAYEDSHIHETTIAGRPIREIMELDNNSDKGNVRCCMFVNQMYKRFNIAGNEVERNIQLKELERDITRIQKEYDAKDITFMDVNIVKQKLREVYEEISIEAFKNIVGLGEDCSEEKLEEIFIELDSFMIGGFGFNSESMGEEAVRIMETEDTTGWSVKNRTHNEKLDALLKIAYADVRSRRYLQGIGKRG